MDLEECILVREFVVSLFTPTIMLMVFIYVESGIIFGFYLFGLRLDCMKKTDVIVCTAGYVSCQEGE